MKKLLALTFSKYISVFFYFLLAASLITFSANNESQTQLEHTHPKTNNGSIPSIYLKPFSEDSPWNKKINSDYLFTNKVPAIKIIPFNIPVKLEINSNQWSIPFYISTKSDPINKIYIEENNQHSYINLPENALPAKGSDGHLCIFNTELNIIYEFYKFSKSSNKNEARAKLLRIIDPNGMGISDHPGMNIGTRAYGGSAVAGLLRKHELYGYDKINHALAVALSRKYLRPNYVWPASSEDSFSKNEYKGNIKMGTLVTINQHLDIDKELRNKLAIKIAYSLRIYGGYIVDSAGRNNLTLYSEPGVNNNYLDEAKTDLNKILDNLIFIEGNPKD
ncbi:MAG: hypothetical protein Q8K19_20340 [Methylicorpusculum sp.]|uniref:hypothetical protein n=1 Tax=Methylicorpusculum sp. TaxID=2713644 RepID=UPI00273200C8|nr:hypothetical protein [Methylicorpusculum sp.]MDP2180850.1 hypothetical protein [Methylicorpusculum sp.]